MGLFQSFDICASGMTAERFRMDTIAQNIANVNTTRTQDGTPYTRKSVIFEEKQLNPMNFNDTLEYAKKFKGDGVRVSSVFNDTSTDYIMEYDPSHPDADEDGYVARPNVNTVTEMTNLIDASRAYEANVTAFNAVKSMAQAGISIGTGS
jgi:flagellar basal-body rod protein FlgC